VTDLHIPHPYERSHPQKLQSFSQISGRHTPLHESEETEALVKDFLSALPGLYRVGFSKFVWNDRRGGRGVIRRVPGSRLMKPRSRPSTDAGSSLP